MESGKVKCQLTDATSIGKYLLKIFINFKSVHFKADSSLQLEVVSVALRKYLLIGRPCMDV